MENNDILLVKNYQSSDIVKRMYENAFHKSPDKIKIMTLSGGLKNAVSLIDDDGEKVVLKISTSDENKMVSLDRNTFWWEAKMLKMMENLDIPTPKLLYFDDSNNLCNSPYIFMTYISGKNYLDVKNNLTENQIDAIEYELGKISSKICSIKSDKFFLPAFPDLTFKNNYEFVYKIFQSLLNDANEKKMSFKNFSYDDIINLIYEKKDSLKNIKDICLSHTDIWDGNVLIDNNKLSGIIDFSDLYYCDKLMTFYFHTVDGKTNKAFLDGFNKKYISNDEKIRIEIYRLLTLLKMMVDVEFKGYGRYEWMYQNFDKQMRKIKKM